MPVLIEVSEEKYNQIISDYEDMVKQYIKYTALLDRLTTFIQDLAISGQSEDLTLGNKLLTMIKETRTVGVATNDS